MKDSSMMKKCLSSHLMMCLDFMIALDSLSLMISTFSTAEQIRSIPRKTVQAQELILDLLKERAETGRIYIMNIDHCNSHTSFIDKVWYE
jgi:ribonucleotide reductase alpha subunit